MYDYEKGSSKEIFMITKMRGTMDILPEQIPAFRYIEETARKVAAKYGFEEIRIPTFEATELFRRGVGQTSDVVQKEMYTFSDLDGRSLTLRPEGTAGVARAVIEHGKCSDAMPLKLFYLINCFRYEAPQAGRSREFFQFGTEMFGAASPAADATVIALAYDVLRELGIKGIKLHINSIGCPECRPKYREALISHLEQKKDGLCDTCKGRLYTNPMRVLDCKSPICKELSQDAPRVIDYLCPDCQAHFYSLKKMLDSMNIEYTIDTGIVRGLDYYTRTVFEFICDDIGAQSTVCGGGRYDGLIKELGGPSLPGIGFAMGITRLILAMEAQGIVPAAKDKMRLYIASLGEAAQTAAVGIVKKLREKGIYCECDLVGRSLKAQMKYADKIGAEYTLIIGDSELESGKAVLKNMSDSTQTEIEISELDKYI